MVFSITLFAQGTGQIAGSVSNKQTGEVITGVTVQIVGMTKGSTTDVSGKYTIQGLPVAKYTVEFAYLGFTSKRITDVEVTNKELTNLDVVLEASDATELEQVVVTGSYKKESIGALYAQQKNSVAISDGISAEIIKKTPDRNTGEILKRVSGASVQDNKYIIIRGLSDRYNATLLNSSPLPSTEADRKAFSFDIIPSSLVDNIVISKTATPDLPGDLTGGGVNIKTKDFPAQQTFEINLGLGANTQTTFKDFYGSTRTTGNYFGMVNTANKLPASFPATRQDYGQYTSQQKAELSKDFKNTWGYSNLGKSLPTQNVQLIYGDTYLLKNEGKLGFIASATYRNSESISPELRNDFNGLDQGKDSYFFQYADNYYEFSSTVGLLANISYIKDRFKISLKNIINQDIDHTFIDRVGSYDNEMYQKSTMLEVHNKRMINSVLDGEYQLTASTLSKLSWNLSYSNVENNQPDLRRLSYSKSLAEKDNPAVPFQAGVPRGSATPSQAGKFYSNLNENIYSAGLNWAYGLNLLGLDQTFKVGVLKQYKKRNVNARVLGYTLNTDSYEESVRLLGLSQDQIFAPENIAPNMFMIDDITNPNNRYDGTGDLNAGFAMLSGQVTESLKATVGLRIENYLEKLTDGVHTQNDLVSNTYTDFLPSLNFTYELTPKTNIRLAYSNTVARAQFRELAEFSFFDFVTNTMRIGNPQLKRTRISNVDLRYEIYPSVGQLLSVSAFYKSLKDPIESNILPGSTSASKTMSFINAPQAYIMGAEIEVRHDLGIFNEESEILKNLIFSANAAIIKSEVDFKNKEPLMENKRSLFGQSPYLLNTGLQYSANSNWETSLFFNRIGRRIDVVGFGNYVEGQYMDEYPTIFEAPRDILDLQVAKKLFHKKGEIKLNVGNLLDSETNFYQDVDKNGKYNAAGDRLINSRKYGRSISLSIGYKF